MKKTFSYLIIFMIIFQFIGCNQSKKVDTQEQNIKLIAPDGLPSMAISKAIVDNKKIGDLNMEYSIEKTTDLLLSELMKGEAELAIVPSNLALQAFKKNLNYRIIGTIGWGSLYLVSTDNISDINEVKGKEIYNTGKGMTPDIVFKQILKQNNINEEDVTLNYVSAASELAPMIISGKAKYAILPEPVLSTVMEKNKDIKIIASLNDEWAKINDVQRGYPQSTLIIKSDLYEEIKNEPVYKELIKVFTESEEWVVNNPQLVVEKCEQIGLSINKDIVENAIKNSNLKFIEVKDTLDEYNIYFKSIDSENKGDADGYDSLFIKE